MGRRKLIRLSLLLIGFLVRLRMRHRLMIICGSKAYCMATQKSNLTTSSSLNLIRTLKTIGIRIRGRIRRNLIIRFLRETISCSCLFLSTLYRVPCKLLFGKDSLSSHQWYLVNIRFHRQMLRLWRGLGCQSSLTK